MGCKIGVDLGIVTRVAVDVPATLGGDCAELDSQGVASVVEMLQGVSVASNAAELLAPTVDEAAGQTQPQIGREIALSALLRDWSVS